MTKGGELESPSQAQELVLLRQPQDISPVTFAPCFSKTRPPIIPLDEIKGFQNLRPQGFGARILQVSATQVVKIGRFVNLHEAESLRLIAEKAPSVPVPEVYNAYRINNLSYIVMEYIPGEDLGCWDTFSAGEKEAVLSQLQKHVAAWRSITASYFGSVVGGPCEDSIFAHSYGKEIKYGPFKSRQQFNEGVVQALRDSRPNPSQYNVSLEKEVLKRQGEEAIFTHGDLGRQNIIYKDGIVTIIDWGSAGFSIREREYVETRWQASMSDDWEQHISTIFPDSNEEDYEFWNRLVNDMRQFSGI